jgi:hypothetical protein
MIINSNCISSIWLRRVLLVAGLAGAFSSACGGNYAPVVTTDLIGAKFNHYYDANMKAVAPPDFAWSFTATNLVIQSRSGPIPTDLLQELAAGKTEVKRIEATWKIETGELVITEIKLDGVLTTTLSRLPVARTAPTVIRIGRHQYVFVPHREPPDQVTKPVGGKAP